MGLRWCRGSKTKFWLYVCVGRGAQVFEPLRRRAKTDLSTQQGCHDGRGRLEALQALGQPAAHLPDERGSCKRPWARGSRGRPGATGFHVLRAET